MPLDGYVTYLNIDTGNFSRKTMSNTSITGIIVVPKEPQAGLRRKKFEKLASILNKIISVIIGNLFLSYSF